MLFVIKWCILVQSCNSHYRILELNDLNTSIFMIYSVWYFPLSLRRTSRTLIRREINNKTVSIVYKCRNGNL